TIAVEGIEVFGYHGVYDQERQDGNNFIVDVYLKSDIFRSAYTDQLADTLDYQQVYEIVLAEMKTPAKLLEHLAYRIARQISNSFPDILALQIKVSKLNPLGMSQCKQTYVDLLFDNEALKGV
ncbi:MAG: dihydroneopterin aldolase, partial [Bacteroidota bacterium]